MLYLGCSALCTSVFVLVLILCVSVVLSLVVSVISCSYRYCKNKPTQSPVSVEGVPGKFWRNSYQVFIMKVWTTWKYHNKKML